MINPAGALAGMLSVDVDDAEEPPLDWAGADMKRVTSRARWPG